MNTLLSFEIAKLLKEKGFDAPCIYFFTENRELYCLHPAESYNGFTPKNEFDLELDCEYPFEYNNLKAICKAPTIAEVVMWCFNKYKYSIEYSMNIPESGEYDGCYVFNGLIKGSEDYKLKIFYTSKDYPTAEKALEDTINHFLINFF